MQLLLCRYIPPPLFPSPKELSANDSGFLQKSELFGIIQNNNALLELEALNFHAQIVYEY